jgi:hypothetical protein
LRNARRVYPDGRPVSSSRVKDLVDIAIIATTQTFKAERLRAAVVSNAEMRKLKLPQRFFVPDTAGWAARYPRVAADAPGTVPGYHTAVSLASQIFDPVLDASVSGVWDPSARAWISP